MRKFADYRILQFEKGLYNQVVDAEEVKRYHFTSEELDRIRYNSGRIVSGTPAEVKEQLSMLAVQFDVDELIISTMTPDARDRRRSFELVANAFELGK